MSTVQNESGYIKSTNPLHVTPGTGAGLATSAKQDTQITAEQAIRAALEGVLSSNYAGTSWTEVHGVSGAPVNNDDFSTARDITDAPEAGKRIVLSGVVIGNQSDNDIAVTLIEETSGTVLFGPHTIPANSTLPLAMFNALCECATADKVIQVQADVAGNLTIDSYYRSED